MTCCTIRACCHVVPPANLLERPPPPHPSTPSPTRHGPPSSPPSVVPPPAHLPRHRQHPSRASRALDRRRLGAITVVTAVHARLDAPNGVTRDVAARTGPIARPKGLTAPAGNLVPGINASPAPISRDIDVRSGSPSRVLEPLRSRTAHHRRGHSGPRIALEGWGSTHPPSQRAGRHRW
ncbi:hypothetical protein HYPSUDRAFT_198884 [Hypholoma sublateritium FD-334 SS-4]|uniref:Uncharacterized protein n=1 Tax=Hypholoma sublateritium (strain FD-334 SS-4) TaxID=945553 RepID=A0A0D2P6R1_HYPSF|nr:hypothetical protein HYPSUDRAFT_198884 [Hypholoma sublateritium FD-334 SS-4]